jgi:hypothetical protein
VLGLAYATLGEVLPRIQDLRELALRADGAAGKAERAAASACLQDIVQASAWAYTCHALFLGPSGLESGRLAPAARAPGLCSRPQARPQPPPPSAPALGHLPTSPPPSRPALPAALPGPQEHESAEPFNEGWLERDDERLMLEAPGAAVTPLCVQPGRVALTHRAIYFQPFNVVSAAPVQVHALDKARGRGLDGRVGPGAAGRGPTLRAGGSGQLGGDPGAAGRGAGVAGRLAALPGACP